MKIVRLFAFAALLSLGFAARGWAQQLTPAWVETGENGAVVARVVIAAPGDCPSLTIDGVAGAMTERVPVPSGFQPACEAQIPRSARSARLGSQILKLPKANPSRIVALGDTGCRIKVSKQASEVQDCKDPAQWPFLQIAALAARQKPDLVIHVGDYLYRESKCPANQQAFCGDSPVGDDWEAWNADFFAPAAKLLAAAPWALARGNHESCARSWRGWFYYLDPRPWSAQCEQYSAPYEVKLGSFELVMLDSSETSEDALVDKQVSIFTKQLSSLHATDAWLVDHHPFWGFKENPEGGAPVPLAAPLQEAWDRTWPKGINVILSGHVHLFELISLDHGRPVQVVAGDGGTLLSEKLQASANGTVIHGAQIASSVVSSKSQSEFGFTVFTRSRKGWRLTLKDRFDHALATCSIRGTGARCGGRS